jgi:2-polyprenyl-3-methyl-5-hydroxy-6-metoxy-1,4-benzoquinol methylase
MRELTKIEYWDQGYVARHEAAELTFDWRNHVDCLIAGKIEGIGLEGKRVLEVGAGDSMWLPYLAKKYPGAHFAGVDFSHAGCRRLADRVAAAHTPLTIDIHNEDMFAAQSVLHGAFDVVLSFGVVEHFTDLPAALLAKRRYLADQGRMFTLIPNMAGSIGSLTKRFNRQVFDMHNPHDWKSFLDGHHRAGLTVTSGGYLGSSNFGVLSSCFEHRSGMSWHAYVFLTRLSKAISLAESRLGNLPVSKTFSPYIYAISRAQK